MAFRIRAKPGRRQFVRVIESQRWGISLLTQAIIINRPSSFERRRVYLDTNRQRIDHAIGWLARFVDHFLCRVIPSSQMKAVAIIRAEFTRHADNSDRYCRCIREVEIVEVGVMSKVICARIKRQIDRVENGGFVESPGPIRQFIPGNGHQSSVRIPLKLRISTWTIRTEAFPTLCVFLPSAGVLATPLLV